MDNAYNFVNVINANSVSDALSQGLRALQWRGVSEPSRNGPVLVAPAPVLTVYANPTRRVLFSPMRDANPFFHLFESLWMLAGRNDLPWLAQFNKRMASYSDDGGLTQPAAYGYRWRAYFGNDQIVEIVEELKRNPSTRRCVLAMWHPGPMLTDARDNTLRHDSDLVAAIHGSADVPCNTHCYFRIYDGRLDLTVTCRSNDIWWGAYGANAAHFSVLLEYVAAHVGVPIGRLYQFSNNYHLYTNIVTPSAALENDVELSDKYVGPLAIEPMPMIVDPVRWDEELALFMAATAVDELPGVCEPFFQHVAIPMWLAWQAHKAKDYAKAGEYARSIYAADWRIACMEWLDRRARKYEGKL